MTKQVLMEALLAESDFKLTEGREIVSVSQAIAAAEKTHTLVEWREAVERIVKAGLDANTESSDSAERQWSCRSGPGQQIGNS